VGFARGPVFGVWEQSLRDDINGSKSRVAGRVHVPSSFPSMFFSLSLSLSFSISNLVRRDVEAVHVHAAACTYMASREHIVLLSSLRHSELMLFLLTKLPHGALGIATG
jgi:hypothetical protein